LIIYTLAPFADALLSAAMLAWNQHKAVRFSPDHFWNAIVRSFSSYLLQGANAEKYRDSIVNHQGEIALIVEMIESKTDRANSAPYGEEFVEKILELINQNNKPSANTIFQSEFTTTTTTSRTCNGLCVMKAMSAYFVYVRATRCGLPEVQLSGNLRDWHKLIAKTRDLQVFCYRSGMDFDWYFRGIAAPLAHMLSTYEMSLEKNGISCAAEMLKPDFAEKVAPKRTNFGWCYDIITGPIQSMLQTYGIVASPKEVHSHDPAPIHIAKLSEEELMSWWQQIINQNPPEGSGSTSYNGWLTRFVAFTNDNTRCDEVALLRADDFPSSFVKGDFVRDDSGHLTKHTYFGGLVAPEYIQGEKVFFLLLG
jgi:hypothetical protein